jgi:2-oxoglutarate decarboxylase
MSDQNESQLDINSWLQDELYQNYLHDKKTVDDSWKTLFEGNGHGTSIPQPNGSGKASQGNGISAPAGAKPAPNPSEQLIPMRGVAAKIAENMIASLTVPTATSQRAIPVGALENSRAAINQQRGLASKSKVSYTHLISWAIVRALADFPSLNDAFTIENGEPFRIVRKQVNMGIAVDVKAKDGSSTLMVPNIKNAGAMTFAQFMEAFDDIVSRARNGKLQMPDFQGTTISLTNPGTVGTLASVPRLVAGQGAIIATGAMDYPAEYQSVTPEMKAHIGVSKVMTITCTYDHRIIQGADSGRFLGKLQSLLNGENGFYQKIFADLGLALPGEPAVVARVSLPAAGGALSVADAIREAAVASLIDAYREHGHLVADLDPLGSQRPPQPDLEPSTYGLTEKDLDSPVASQAGRSLREILQHLRKTYCDKIASEYMYIQFPEQREWLRQRLEAAENQRPLDRQVQLGILDRLIEAEEFEHFLQTRFIGKKRFSIEGGESAIVMLDQLMDRAGNAGVGEVIMGMAHRGRLTILANIVGKPLHQVFSEFEEAPDSVSNEYGSGDVKYHLGAHGVRKTSQGKEISIYVAFNPSHLEAVDPVVEGMVRPRQDRLGDTKRDRVIPVLIHGDAAFAGQGVVPETLNLSQLEGYSTGGTVHLIINNQLGFTTPPSEARSGTYSSDIARAIQAPIFHVNGDDPEAVLRVTQIAFDFRQQFNRDVVVDMFCYRRLGHNEGDDPSYTQPLMYKKIKAHPSVVTQYAEKLIVNNALDKAGWDDRKKQYVARLSEAFDITKKNAEAYELQEVQPSPAPLPGGETAIDQAAAEQIVHALTTIPADFHLHPKLGKGFVDKRKELLNGAPMDWAMGEAMAFGSLLLEGNGVRLSGQDSSRGTFSQRHLEFFDYEDGHKYSALQHVAPEQGRFEVCCSSLSEYAVMGFEFGFSVTEPNALVMWEGQFGDFVNGAQITIDQFICCAEYKWGTPCGLVLLLPHGYEGMGPEHSSARIERFLQLCAENNMQVANCTTPAQYFHILRRQMRGGPDAKPIRKPLVIFTPKSMLRHPKATSHLNELTSGGFQEVIPDTNAAAASGIKRVLFCSGKVYYDLLEGREKRSANNVALVRVEQMYPFPVAEVQSILQQYPANAEIYWVQEEPRNMGPYRFMMSNIQPILDASKRMLRYAGRPESASPAAGTTKRHEQEQAEIVEDAFAEQFVNRKPKRIKVVPKKKR